MEFSSASRTNDLIKNAIAFLLAGLLGSLSETKNTFNLITY